MTCSSSATSLYLTPQPPPSIWLLSAYSEALSIVVVMAESQLREARMASAAKLSLLWRWSWQPQAAMTTATIKNLRTTADSEDAVKHTKERLTGGEKIEENLFEAKTTCLILRHLGATSPFKDVLLLLPLCGTPPTPGRWPGLRENFHPVLSRRRFGSMTARHV